MDNNKNLFLAFTGLLVCSSCFFHLYYVDAISNMKIENTKLHDYLYLNINNWVAETTLNTTCHIDNKMKILDNKCDKLVNKLDNLQCSAKTREHSNVSLNSSIDQLATKVNNLDVSTKTREHSNVSLNSSIDQLRIKVNNLEVSIKTIEDCSVSITSFSNNSIASVLNEIKSKWNQP